MCHGGPLLEASRDFVELQHAFWSDFFSELVRGRMMMMMMMMMMTMMDIVSVFLRALQRIFPRRLQTLELVLRRRIFPEPFFSRSSLRRVSSCVDAASFANVASLSFSC